MILGITGTDGAGKGVVVDYLVREKGFTHYSSRALISEEIEKRGLTPDRDTLRAVANDLRREYGNEFIVRRSYENAERDGVKNAVIESLRALAEVEYLKSKGGMLIAVDANQHLRYERIQARKSPSDQVSFEKFCEQEALEMNDPDPNGMQKAAVIASADYTILNNNTLTEVKKQVDDILKTTFDV